MNHKLLLLSALLAAAPAAMAIGESDPACVVEKWSEVTTSPKIIDINFTDTSWPNTWLKEGTGIQCPEWSEDRNGGYVNAVIGVPANGSTDITYPVTFHNCVFATKAANNGYVAATAAFCRQYYEGQKATNYNDWKQAGHTTYLEDNIQYDAKTKLPIYGEAGFVQMCRSAAVGGKSMHGWVEIDHIPYVDRLQWSWSSTSWGRGIKCDIKIGDGDWKPLVWMGSERQKQGWTVFSDQGYFMENEINAYDVSLRWRVWDGEDLSNPVQTDASGACPFTQSTDPNAQRQAPRLHKIKIYGTELTAADADFARNNRIGDPGTLTDLSDFGYSEDKKQPAPDDEAEIVAYVVAQDGSGDFTTISRAIEAVPDAARGLIYIRPGVYDENIYAGTKEARNKFISLIGEDRDKVILTSSVDRGSANPGNTFLDCAALNVFVDRFYAENLTIRNTAGNVGQAEALYTYGDAHIFKNVTISGYQDTYKSTVGSRGYFTGCLVEGVTDFIYDAGLEWFEDCEIRALKGRGYLTAPGTSSMPMTRVMYPELTADAFYPGLFFNKCKLTAEDGVAAGAYTFGRPWGERSGSMFLNCAVGNHISEAGWTAWGGAEATSSLWEYNNTDLHGNALSTASRAAFSRQATEAEVEAYCNPEFLFGNLSKVPFDYCAIINSAPVPDNFIIVNGDVRWDNVAPCYIVYRNGEFFQLLEEPYFTVNDNATYTVKSISRYGVTSNAVEAREATRMLAFPTAEGFGKYTSGGRGGKVVKVTSLADDGSAGTLRWAFNQYKGEPITIVFEVSGNIVLNSELRINRSDWTLAGQTAPGQGIVITRNKVNLGGSSNFIVRNVRFRIGRLNVAGNIMTDNALGAENCSNFIFDHCSFGWSVEENMNTADSHFLTVQYSIVHEGLYNAGHSKGSRGYGCQWGGSPATYHHNLLAHNNSRSARLNGARGEDHLVFMEYVNNVNFNYGKNGGCYGGENTAPVASYNGLNSAHECNFIGNYYIPGPYSNKNSVVFIQASYARDGATSWAPAKWFVNGNYAPGLTSYNNDNWLGVTAETYTKDQIRVDSRITPANPYYKYSLAAVIGKYVPEHYMLENIEDAQAALQTVLEKAGTINRDKVEARIIDEVKGVKATYGGATGGKGKGILDSETDAEGFFDYEPATAETDSDGDGMPDNWETANGLNPFTADNNRLNTEGYTALEVYLNSLMGEQMNTNFDAGVELIVESCEISYDNATATLTASERALGSNLAVYAANGSLVAYLKVNSTETSLAFLQPGFYILNLSSPTLATRTLKIVR